MREPEHDDEFGIDVRDMRRVECWSRFGPEALEGTIKASMHNPFDWAFPMTHGPLPTVAREGEHVAVQDDLVSYWTYWDGAWVQGWI